MIRCDDWKFPCGCRKSKTIRNRDTKQKRLDVFCNNPKWKECDHSIEENAPRQIVP